MTVTQGIEAGVMRRHQLISDFMDQHIIPLSADIDVRGLGCIWGIDVHTSEASSAIQRACFDNGVILERAGRDNGVVKIMPSLVIPDDTLMDGLGIIRDCVAAQLS